MDQPLQEQQVTLKDYLRILYKGRWIIVLAFLAVVSSTLYFTLKATPVYQVATTIMIETEKEAGALLPFELGGVTAHATMINNQVEVLKSRSLAEAVVDTLVARGYGKSFHLFGTEEELSHEDVVGSLRETVEVSPRRDTDIIEIKLEAEDPQEASIIANTIAEVYYLRSLENTRGEIREVKNFLDEQLEQKKRELEEAEQRLLRFREAESAVVLSGETRELVEQLAELELLYSTAETEKEVAETRLSHLRTQYADQLKNLPESLSRTVNTLVGDLRSEVAKFENIYVNLIAQGRWSEDHPKLLEIKDRIEDIRLKIRDEMKGVVEDGGVSVANPLAFSESLLEKILTLEVDVKAAEAKTRVLGGAVKEYSERLNSLPAKEIELARLERTYRVDEKIYVMMEEKYQESRVTEAGLIGNVRIIDKAVPPKYPIKPKKRLNMILAALVGLGLGVGVTFLLEYLDTSVRIAEDVERYIRLPLLGVVPTIQPEGRRRRRKGREGSIGEISSKLVTQLGPKVPVSEAYRTLRTNIQFSNPDSPLQTLLVTSPGPKDGKSITVANLAVTMAQMGTKVLLVDSDCRRPILHSLFGEEREKGLSNVLVGDDSLAAAIRQTDVENLSLLPCGPIPPNPSELLGSQRMRDVIEEMKEDYGLILFDSPPVVAVTDACVLATVVDGTILVVRSGRADREIALRARSLLENVRARVLGVVLNDFDVESQYGSYYYYYYYYYYYGYGEKEGKRGFRRRRKK